MGRSHASSWHGGHAVASGQWTLLAHFFFFFFFFVFVFVFFLSQKWRRPEVVRGCPLRSSEDNSNMGHVPVVRARDS